MKYIVILILLLKYVNCVVIKGYLSQDNVQGQIELNQEQPNSDVIVKVVLNLLKPTENIEHIQWQIREFPVDYQIINGRDRCNNEKLGKVIINLTERLGTLNLPLSSTFIIPGGHLNISGTNGIWGRSILLHGPRLACSTLMIHDGDERTAEAKFNGVVAGTVLFRWFGTADTVDAIIYSDLIGVTEENKIKYHKWKIYVTDVLESEADKARDNCNALQIIFDPHNRGLEHLCNKDNLENCRAGDLDLRLGKLRSGSRHFSRDLYLPQLQIESGEPRTLYLVIFDPDQPDSILTCARIKRTYPKKASILLRGSGLKVNFYFEQTTPYDLTYVSVKNYTYLYDDNAIVDWEYNIHELPVRGNSIETCKNCGPVYDPSNAQDDTFTTGSTQDNYPIGRLKLKYGHLNKLLNNNTWDSFLPLFGKNSIIHRSMYAQYHNAIACATVLPNKEYITAQALFRYPVVGRILFRQLKEEPLSDTTILIEYLVYADGNKNDTADLKWKINSNPAGADFYNWTSRCLSAGPVYNPFKVLVDKEKENYCHSDRPSRCAVGDLSNRHEKILAVGSKVNMILKTRRLYTDTNLPLTGPGGIVGKSVVIYHEHGPKARGERLACTTINWLHRQKAVARDWFSNGFEIELRGKIEMLQLTEYDLTNLEVNLKDLDDNAGYHVHVSPVEIHLTYPCEDSSVSGHWNPFNIIPSKSPPPGTGSPDQYEMGDLSGKFGTLANLSQINDGYNDTNLDLIGPNSVLGRSIVIHKAISNKRWACSSIERGYAPSEARELRAIASFHHPNGFAYGYIRLTQLIYNDGSSSNTAIEVKLRHPGENDRNVTRNHNWAVYVNPVGHDASVKTFDTRCVAGGYRWNPYFIQLADPFNDELYREECGPDNPLRCHVGDLSGRLGTIDLGDQRQSFTDINLPLEGGIHSVLGKSIVIFNKDKGPERYACANIEADNDIVKYANIRKTPRFEINRFLDRVREIMGLPEWMLYVDSRKSKELHNGACVQILLHFTGPQAHKLEQDFSRLLELGSLSAPSLYIPGALPNPKRPTKLSYKQCGTKDNSDRSNNRNKNSHNSSRKLVPTVLINLNFIVYYFVYKILNQ